MRVSGEVYKAPRRRNRPNSRNGQQHKAAISGRSRQKRAPRAGGKIGEAFRYFDWDRALDAIIVDNGAATERDIWMASCADTWQAVGR